MHNLPWIWNSNFYNPPIHMMDRNPKGPKRWYKKEYRKITGKSVALTKEGEIDVRVESANRRYTWATAYQMYKIGGLDNVIVVEAGSKDTLEKSWKTFLDQGGWKGKRPKNDTRPKGETK